MDYSANGSFHGERGGGGSQDHLRHRQRHQQIHHHHHNHNHQHQQRLQQNGTCNSLQNGSRRKNGMNGFPGRAKRKCQDHTQVSDSSSRSSGGGGGLSPCSVAGDEVVQQVDEQQAVQQQDDDEQQVNGEVDGQVDEQEQELIPGLTDDIALFCLARLPRSTYGLYFTVSRKFFEKFRQGEIYKARQQLGIVEQWMYILSDGHQRVWRAFNPRDRRWRQLESIPSDYTFAVSDKETLTAGTQLLVRGMEVQGYVVWIYDLVRDKWFKGPDMIHSRCLYASATCGLYGFVAGGAGMGGNNLKSAERYNSVAGIWEALPELNRSRRLCSGFYMDRKFYVIGGQDGCEQLTCGEEYDPVRGSWKVIPGMYFGRSEQSHAPPLVAVVDDELYALDTGCNELKVYNKSSNSWSTLGTVPVRVDINSGWGIAFKAVEGELYVIGGDQEAPTHIQIWAWKPRAQGPPVWEYVTMLGTFIYNCAVMAA